MSSLRIYVSWDCFFWSKRCLPEGATIMPIHLEGYPSLPIHLEGYPPLPIHLEGYPPLPGEAPPASMCGG